MRDFIQLLTALCVLAAVQYLALALSVALLILLLMAAVAHPRRTLHLLATVGLLALAFKAPAHCAAAIGATAIAMVLASRIPHRPEVAAPALLTYDRATLPSGSNGLGGE